jgi:hypothetical protein
MAFDIRILSRFYRVRIIPLTMNTRDAEAPVRQTIRQAL